MTRRVLVYRAETGVQNVFGNPDPGVRVTPPEERRPIDTFTICEEEPDRARLAAQRFVTKRHREVPESIQFLTDGSISVTLRAPPASS